MAMQSKNRFLQHARLHARDWNQDILFGGSDFKEADAALYEELVNERTRSV